MTIAHLSLCPTAAEGEPTPNRLARPASKGHPAGTLDHVSAAENEIINNGNLIRKNSTDSRFCHQGFHPAAKSWEAFRGAHLDTATSRRLGLPLLLWRRGLGRGGRHPGRQPLPSSATASVPLSPTLSPRSAGGERTPRHFDALCAPEPGWGRLVPSRNDRFAGCGDEPSPPRFRGRRAVPTPMKPLSPAPLPLN